MNVNIILFGQLTDITGTGSITLDNVDDTETLVKALHLAYPKMATASYVIAVDKKLISTNTKLIANCTVALLPPFSGG